MTKRVSLPGAGLVPATNVVAAEAGVEAAVVQPVAAAEVGAAVKVEAPTAPGMIGTDAGLAVEMVEPSIVEFVAPVGAAVQDAAAEPAQDTTATDPAATTATTTQTYDDGAQDMTPYIVGGVLLGGAILALALSGGDDDDTPAPPPPPPPPPPPANQAPTFSSGTTATVAENAATSTLVLDVNATDPNNNTITYSIGGADAAAFTINATNGEVRLNQSANFENKASYTFTVTATDNGSPVATATQTITVTVTDANDAPTFATATATATVAENVDVATAVFTADADDVDAGSTITYSLTGEDAAAFTIDAATGEVRFVASPDFETKSAYNVNVVATDNGNPALTATQALTVTVTDVAEGPVVTAVDIDGAGIPAGESRTYDAADGDFNFVENGGEGNVSRIINFDEGDFITTDTLATTYGFQSENPDGGPLADLIVSASINGVTTTITLVDAVGTNLPVFNEASAERALGFDFFRSSVTPPVGGGSLTGTQTLDAAGTTATYNEDTNTANDTTINGFGTEDRIIVSNAAGRVYGFQSENPDGGSAADLIISFSDQSGVVSEIRLTNVVRDDVAIFNEASAEAALGADFFSYA